MCSRGEAAKEYEAIARFWEKKYREGYRWKPSVEFNAYDHPEMLVTTSEEPDLVQPMNWGIIPPWVKDEAEAKKMINGTINAKAETVFQLPSFRSISKKRCLIYMTGFYEWQHVGKEKIKYRIGVKDMECLAMGGLYDSWVNKSTGEIYTGFSIITCPANKLMEEIHNSKKRMPFILESKDAGNEWLAPHSKEELKELIKQFPSERMYAEAV